MEHTETMLEKIPDFIMLRLMKKERGQLISEIDYLNHELEKACSLTREERVKLCTDAIYRELTKKASTLEKTVRRQRVEIEKLICRNIELLKKIPCECVSYRHTLLSTPETTMNTNALAKVPENGLKIEN